MLKFIASFNSLSPARKEITSLKIDPCPKSPCKFNPGDQVNITVEFIANQDTDWVKLYGSLRTGGLFAVTVPYIGIDENACNKGFTPNKLDCPIVKGKKYKFVLTQTVPYYSRFNVSKNLAMFKRDMTSQNKIFMP